MTTDAAKSVDALARLVEILSPLQSEDRSRVVRAAMVLLGEDSAVVSASEADVSDVSVGNFDSLPPRAQVWVRQYSIAPPQLDQIFHLTNGVVEIIATRLPGRNKKEQTLMAYIVAGIGQLLLTGNASFDDKSARALCESLGCYDSANHSTYLKDRGNEFTGSKERGWTLTAPGLKRGADLVKDMSKLNG